MMNQDRRGACRHIVRVEVGTFSPAISQVSAGLRVRGSRSRSVAGWSGCVSVALRRRLLDAEDVEAVVEAEVVVVLGSPSTW